MAEDRTDVRLAGAGGQGVVTAGRILAEAAILSGRRSAHSQVYGPQSRGGASRSDVVIASDDIGYPLADEFDVLVLLSSEACLRYGGDASGQTLVILDDRADFAGVTGKAFPIVETARRIVASPVATGVVALGVVQGLIGIVDDEALANAVAAGVPPASRADNQAALSAGMALGRGQ